MKSSEAPQDVPRGSQHPLLEFALSEPSLPRGINHYNLHAWTFQSREIEQAINGKRLLNPSIDLSNPCNLNCPYCFIEEKQSTRKKRRPHELTLEETFYVIEDFAAAGARTINIVGAGEPTIDPHFQKILSVASKLGLNVLVFTNGIAIAKSDLLDHIPLESTTFVIKYNSGYSTRQDKLVGQDGYTLLRDEALRKLIDYGYADCNPSRLGIDVLVLRSVFDEIPDIYYAARLLNIIPLVADYIPTGRTDDGYFVGEAALLTLGMTEEEGSLFEPVGPEERTSLHNALKGIDRQIGIQTVEGPHSYYGAGQCTQILGLYIDIVGNIWPCVARSQKHNGGDIKKKPLGNVRNEDVPSNIWSNHPYMKLIRENYNGGCPYKATLG